jgi:TRAP transporter 4TM/12TM fusion protein
MGMISGSAAANVATVGTFTIPLMISSGYKNTIAAAIESCASTGGQFMPPVMGAAAFVIAATLGIPYGRVCLAAIIPAILFYVYLFVNVDLEARKANIGRIEPENIPSLSKTLKDRGHLLLPLLLLIVLMILGYSPGKSVFWSIVLLIITAELKKTTRVGLKELLQALEEGIVGTIPIAAACAGAGIIGGVISLTGLGLSFSSILIQLAGNSTFILLILTMIASLILGMGLPTTACYIILAVLTAPALQNLGAPPLATHFFIFFYGCISTITPPVALSAYCAAGIAKSNPMKTGYAAFRMGFIAFVIPFIAFYSPGLLFEGQLTSTIYATFSSILILFSLAFAFEGQGFKRRLTWPERSIFIAAACLFLVPHNYLTFAIGCIVMAVGLTLERLRKVEVSEKLAR